MASPTRPARPKRVKRTPPAATRGLRDDYGEAFPNSKRVYLEGPGGIRVPMREVALSGGEGKTVIEIDAPRDRELQAGEIIGLQPRRYRIFAVQD